MLHQRQTSSRTLIIISPNPNITILFNMSSHVLKVNMIQTSDDSLT